MDKLNKIQSALENASKNSFIVVRRHKSHTKLAKATLAAIHELGNIKDYFFDIHKKHNVDKVDVEFRKPRGTSSVPFGEIITLEFVSSPATSPTPIPQGLGVGTAGGLNGGLGALGELYFNKISEEGRDYKSKYESKVIENEVLKDKVNELHRNIDKLDLEHKFQSEGEKDRKPFIDKETGTMIMGVLGPILQNAMSKGSAPGLNAVDTSLNEQRKNIIKYAQMAQVPDSIMDRLNFVLLQFLNEKQDFITKLENIIQQQNEPT